MKEGGAAIGRGGAATMSGRGPALGGARGLSRGFGVSLSADAGSLSFGSKNLVGSKSARSISFNIPSSKPAGMFDISRPVRSASVVPHVAEFQFGLSVKNGTERRSKTARTESHKPQGIFDITRPVSQNIKSISERKTQGPIRSTSLKSINLFRAEGPKSLFGRKPQEKVTKPTELSFTSPISLNIDNGRKAKSPEARIKSLEPARILFDLSKKPAFEKASLRKTLPKIDLVKAGSESKIKSPEVRLVIPKVSNEVLKTIKVKPEQVNIKKEQKKRVKTLKTDRPHLTHIVKASPQVSDLERRLVYADLSMAKKVIPFDARVRGISLAEAEKQAIKRLSEKHKNKIVITPVEPLVTPNVSPQLQSVEQTVVNKKAQTDTLTRNDGKRSTELNVNNNQDVGGGTKLPEPTGAASPKSPKKEDPLKEKEFFFEKQVEVNKKRIERAVSALDSLLKSRKNDTLPAGQEIADLISDSDTQFQSEMAKPVHKDGSLKKFKDAVGKLKEVTHLGEFIEKLDEIVDKYPAIKLSVSKPKPNEGVNRKKVEHIYEGPIDGKQAFFKDYMKVNGNFQGQSEKTYFIPSANLPGAPVV